MTLTAQEACPNCGRLLQSRRCPECPDGPPGVQYRSVAWWIWDYLDSFPLDRHPTATVTSHVAAVADCDRKAVERALSRMAASGLVDRDKTGRWGLT